MTRQRCLDKGKGRIAQAKFTVDASCVESLHKSKGEALLDVEQCHWLGRPFSLMIRASSTEFYGWIPSRMAALFPCTNYLPRSKSGSSVDILSCVCVCVCVCVRVHVCVCVRSGFVFFVSHPLERPQAHGVTRVPLNTLSSQAIVIPRTHLHHHLQNNRQKLPQFPSVACDSNI